MVQYQYQHEGDGGVSEQIVSSVKSASAPAALRQGPGRSQISIVAMTSNFVFPRPWWVNPSANSTVLLL